MTDFASDSSAATSHEASTRVRGLRPAILLAALAAAPCLSAPAVAQGGDGTGSDAKAVEVLDLMERTQLGDCKTVGAVAILARGTCRLELSAGPGRGQPLEGEYVEYISADGRARGKGSFGKNMSFEYGHDGEVLWEMDPAEGMRILSEAQRIDRARTFLLKAGANWRSLYRTVRLAEDRPDSYAITMIPKKGSEETWWISKKHHRLVRIAMPWGDQDITVDFAGHRRDASGLEVAGAFTVKLGFATIRYTVDKIEIDARIDPKRFELPAEVREELAKRAKRVAVAKKKGNDDSISLESVRKRATATIRVRISAPEMGKTLAVLLPELWGALSKQGVMPVGPPFARFHKVEDGKIDLEAGFPVSAPIKASGRVQPNHLPAGQTVQTWHKGNYQGLAQSYAKVEAWIAENGYEKSGPSWEVYWTDPGKVKDPAKWRTRLVYPVRALAAKKTAPNDDGAPGRKAPQAEKDAPQGGRKGK